MVLPSAEAVTGEVPFAPLVAERGDPMVSMAALCEW